MVLFYRLSGSFAAMSFVGALFVIISYLSMPVLRKHPTNMVFYLSISDLMFSIKFILTAVIPDSEELEKNKLACFAQAGWAQFWGLASISWNGMISLNLIINLHKQGFARTSNLGKFYHMLVWGLSITTTAIMFSFPSRIGSSGDGTCWIGNATDPFRLLFFVPLLLYFTVSIYAVILGFVRTSNGVMSEAVRRGVMLRMTSYVAVFLICWSFLVIHRIYVLAHPEKQDTGVLPYMDNIGISIQGFANAMVWLTNPSFFSSFKSHVIDKYFGWAFPKTEEQHPILAGIQDNLTDSRQDIHRIGQILRKNIITCILLGVQQSLRHTMQNNVTQKCYSDSKTYNHEELYADGEDAKDGQAQTFEFTDYAPIVFAQIRELSAISVDSYRNSMSPANFKTLSDQLAKFSDGRSNSFFIFSPDKKFIIKTINDEEAQVLLKMLPSLHRYFMANPHSLITRFYGCHAVRVSHGELVHIVVMGNVFSSPIAIHECYDLKGSWVNRSAKREEASKLGMDLDLARQLSLDPARRDMFLDQLQKDSLFLCSVNIMDYSLLLGFHFLDRDSADARNSQGGVELTQILSMAAPSTGSLATLPGAHGLTQLVSTDRNELYCVGIIDVLQQYTRGKKMERFAKVYMLHKDGAGLSSMPPRPYAERFYNAMCRLVGGR